jgi:cytochrome c
VIHSPLFIFANSNLLEIRQMKFVVLVAAVVAATPVLASKELAQKNACLACHAADKDRRPGLQDVAKYAAKGPEAMLARASRRRVGQVDGTDAGSAALSDADARPGGLVLTSK